MTAAPVTTPVTAPVDVVAKLSTTLAIHHAPHLLPGVLACLAPHLSPYPSEGGRRAGDVGAVIALTRVLAGDGRPDLLTRVLQAVTPWLPLAPAIPTATGGLTVRQVEMLHLVSYGFSNGEIARKLAVTEQTVKTHLKRAYLTLDARDRAHAVWLALKCGALTLDD